MRWAGRCGDRPLREVKRCCCRRGEHRSSAKHSQRNRRTANGRPYGSDEVRWGTNLSVGFAASSPWEGEPRGVAVFHGHAPWGRAGAQRLRGGILRISRTSDLLPMFLLKQWPPLRMQACCFPQKHGISTASASLRSRYGFLLLRALPQIYTSLT